MPPGAGDARGPTEDLEKRAKHPYKRSGRHSSVPWDGFYSKSAESGVPKARQAPQVVWRVRVSMTYAYATSPGDVDRPHIGDGALGRAPPTEADGGVMTWRTDATDYSAR